MVLNNLLALGGTSSLTPTPLFLVGSKHPCNLLSNAASDDNGIVAMLTVSLTPMMTRIMPMRMAMRRMT